MNTPEIQERKSKKLKGRVFSEETKKRMSESAKNRANRDPEHLSKARESRRPQVKDSSNGRFAPQLARMQLGRAEGGDQVPYGLPSETSNSCVEVSGKAQFSRKSSSGDLVLKDTSE
jgi:hypothetical protein